MMSSFSPRPFLISGAGQHEGKERGGEKSKPEREVVADGARRAALRVTFAQLTPEHDGRRLERLVASAEEVQRDNRGQCQKSEPAPGVQEFHVVRQM